VPGQNQVNPILTTAFNRTAAGSTPEVAGGMAITRASAPSPNAFNYADAASKLTSSIQNIVLSNPKLPAKFAQSIMWDAVAQAIQTTLVLLIPPGLAEAAKEQAFKEFSDLITKNLTGQNIVPSVGSSLANTAAMIAITDYVAPAISNATVTVISKQFPDWSKAHPVELGFIGAGIEVAIIDGTAFASGASKGGPWVGVASVAVTDAFQVVKYSIDISTNVNALQQYVAAVRTYKTKLRDEIQYAMTIKDQGARKALLSTSLRALNELDGVIASNPILQAQVGY
jgi:hypothetical protein